MTVSLDPQDARGEVLAFLRTYKASFENYHQDFKDIAEFAVSLDPGLVGDSSGHVPLRPPGPTAAGLQGVAQLPGVGASRGAVIGGEQQALKTDPNTDPKTDLPSALQKPGSRPRGGLIPRPCLTAPGLDTGSPSRAGPRAAIRVSRRIPWWKPSSGESTTSTGAGTMTASAPTPECLTY